MRKKLLWMFLAIPLILSLLNVNTIEVTAAATHDIAVTSVIPSPTSVKLGELVNITVVVENQGTENETFDVTTYRKTTPIETQTNITLVAGANTALTFVWNTTDVRDEIYAEDKKEKEYTINATATTVPGETPADTEDNTLTSPSKVRVISQYIMVIPQSTVDPTLTPGKNYTISIYTDYNGSDVWGYQFSLSYNPSVLNGSEVTNGDLIVGETAIFMPGEFDNVAGELSSTGAFFFFMDPDPAPLTSGPGTLATVTFTVVGTGDSDITLGDETKLMGEEYNIISDYKPHIGHILHGYFRNTAEVVTHDVAILSVTLSNTTVTEGDLVNITVVVENQGTVAETFTVAAYYRDINPNYRIATTKTVQNLGAGANASLIFVWNTTDVKAGSHTIWAEAGTVPGETDTEDNTLEKEDAVTVKALPRQRGPIELIIGIVVVVVLVGAVAAYAVKRRRKPTPE